MNTLLDKPADTLALKGRLARLWDDPDTRSVIIGILGVILVHILILLTAPHVLPEMHPSTLARRQATPRTFNIQIAPDAFVKQAPKPPPNKFVETNPNAPENIPDNTTNFGARNQQAAQEKAQQDAHNDRPKIEGRKDIHSSQIVTGHLDNPVEKPAPIVPPTPKVAQNSTPRQAQNPLSGYEKKQGEDKDSYGTNISNIPQNTKPIAQKVEGANEPVQGDASTAATAIDPRHPKPRPVLESMKVRPAIFEDNPVGTRNVGIVGQDARWSNYGAYLERMEEAVQAAWDRILIESATNPPPGTHVMVRFRIDDKGRIVAILDQQSTSSEQGTATCISAITSRSPYGEWTDDMKAVLGTSQDMTFTFYFE